MQGKDARSATKAVYIGCDVSKRWIDVHAHPIGKSWRVANDRQGIKALKRTLERMEVAIIVLEATGRWHRQVWRSLSASGLPVAIVDPYRARRFAQATGRLEKTDRIDARMLALFAEAMRPEAKAPPSEDMEALQELVNAWHAAKEEVTALSNRQKAATCAFLKRDIGHALRAMRNHVARLEAEILRRIEADPRLAERYAILMSIPGIGPVVAITLLVLLDELGHVSGKHVAKLAGVAPMAWESGTWRGQRHIQGGRARVRKLLYMAAVSAGAMGANTPLKAFYDRLRARQKPAKVAITAVMRKLIVLANTLLAEGRKWQPTPPKTA